MHDITELERRGIPGVFVASHPFGEAADSQGAALGYHPDHVLVPHPIQDRTDQEMRVLAEGAIDALVTALCREPPP